MYLVTGCSGFIRLDFHPPDQRCHVILTLRAASGSTAHEYLLTATGLADPATAESGEEPWRLCPLTGDALIHCGPIHTADGIESIHIEYRAGALGLAEEITDLPMFEYEAVPMDALDALRRMRERAVS